MKNAWKNYRDQFESMTNQGMPACETEDIQEKYLMSYVRLVIDESPREAFMRYVMDMEPLEAVITVGAGNSYSGY